ncbi:MAG: macro domain-containing protein [Planctomycetes bacterium]|nr:macro domain-containing protein [Planctomycetota bacterium]
MTRIHIEQGDLTGYEVDAIVNAANNDLQLGGGLAGAIRRAGGPSIQAECDRHGPVRVGEAAITGAGELPARYVIHQASMRLGGRTTADSLRNSTRAVLRLAEENGVRSLAFPATGTGIAGFPLDQCAEIMLGEVLRHVRGQTGLTDVYFVLFDARGREIFQRTYERLKSQAPPS